MNKFNRIFMIITDGLGAGEGPRTAEFGDKGAYTFKHVADTGLLNIPNWEKLGIGSIIDLGKPGPMTQTGYTLKMQELSNAKDTLAGHWEMMGIETKVPFPTFTDTGFPKEMLEALEKKWGRKIVGNRSASGTEIIDELADEENKNGKIIVYTSADSVLQIPGNEDIMGVKTLHKYAKEAREILDSRPEWKVGRIIARPYKDVNGVWVRTANRHDYAVNPPHDTVLNELQKVGVKTIGLGKIRDIFVGQGIDEFSFNESDEHGMQQIINHAAKDTNKEFVFLNLVDFDSKFGHRRNIKGYAENINLIDRKLGELIKVLKEDDLLMITSDHGNDPSFPGSDHTRELLPLTIFSKSFKEAKKLNNVVGMGTTGNIIARNFGVPLTKTGEDIFDKMK